MNARGKAVVSFWKETICRWVDDDLIHSGQCFACGSTADHVAPTLIKAHKDGGKHTMINTHNLCGHCAIESRHLSGYRYWRWFDYKLNNEFDMGIRHITAVLNSMPKVSAEVMTAYLVESSRDRKAKLLKSLHN